jgi:hypothetical protein
MITFRLLPICHCEGAFFAPEAIPNELWRLPAMDRAE